MHERSNTHHYLDGNMNQERAKYLDTNRLRNNDYEQRRQYSGLAQGVYRPLFEKLEQRWLLTNVIALDPIPSTNEAPIASDISATFDADINPASVSAETFSVQAAQTGKNLQPLSVSDNTITLSPSAPLHAGELVQVTATRGVESKAGEPLATPSVWQFRAASKGGTGLLDDSGQRLGGLDNGAVALGDLDGDGDLDAFVGSNRFFDDERWDTVWLNEGNGRFSDSGQRLGDSFTWTVLLGDLDGDGDLDSLVGSTSRFVNRRFVSYTVWLNDGSGRFTENDQTLEANGGVALGDLDGDGDLDIFAANHPFVDSGDWGQPFIVDAPNSVWLNDGSGTFVDSGQGLHVLSGAVALGDVDNDGDLDAFVANQQDNGEPNRVWLNDGSGAFTDSGLRLGNASSTAVALGDLDGDGDLDALVANGQVRDPEVDAIWLNDGGGRFTDSGQSPSFGSSTAISLGDLDGDGDLDAFVGTQSYTPDEVWINDNGRFTEQDQEMPNGYTHSAALGDVDGDGDLDAFLGHSGRGNTVWLNRDADPARLPGDANGDLRFDQADIVQVLQAAKYLTGASATFEEGDWNGDGFFDQLDIVAALQSGNYLTGPNAVQAVDAIFEHN